jgi:succinoglycan biosynthesis protein ExoA
VTRRFDDVLVVIPCLNEEAHLPGLLDTLLGEAPGATIVVADGGSHDASRAIVSAVAARAPAVRLLDNPACIQSAGVNRAAMLFGEGKRWLVRIDAHCRYPADYVAGLLDAATRTGADALVVPMRSVGIGCFQRAAAAAQNSRLGTGGSPHRHVGTGRFIDHGHHALFQIERFLAIGGYDEGFSHNEDAELDHRQTLSGARIWLEPGLALDYFPRAAPGALFRQYLKYGRGRAMTIRRHRMPVKLRQLLPLAVVPALLLLLLAPWQPLLALPAMAWGALSLGYGLAIGLRTGDRCAMLSGVAAMLMHAGWALGFIRRIATPPER